jgi:uncharacterized protein (DUF2461 family)
MTPGRHALTRIRDAIVAYLQRWQHVISSKAFCATGSLGDDSLKRHPSGDDSEHPLLAELKRKDDMALVHFMEAQTCTPDAPHGPSPTTATSTCRQERGRHGCYREVCSGIGWKKRHDL